RGRFSHYRSFLAHIGCRSFWCGREDLNLHTPSGTCTSSMRVCQFAARPNRKEMLGAYLVCAECAASGNFHGFVFQVALLGTREPRRQEANHSNFRQQDGFRTRTKEHEYNGERLIPECQTPCTHVGRQLVRSLVLSDLRTKAAGGEADLHQNS